ncbi:MAG TPA: alpha/beta hydrolase [Rhizomicrobium sp.]|nr:alpha/beta hydrolase [Rhizomicrobium sp.]
MKLGKGWRVWVGGVAGALVMLALAGRGYEVFAEANDAKAFKATGMLVDIGGRKLHIDCTGSGSGPVVVVEAGAGTPAMTWLPVQRLVQNSGKICTYDRAGFGSSDPAPNPSRSFDDRAADLYNLLHAAKLQPPYILVGEAYGGFIVRRFASDHPKEVAGVVLVDALEEQEAFTHYPEMKAKYEFRNQLGAWAASEGLMRAYVRAAPAAEASKALWDNYTPEERDQLVATLSNPKYWQTEAHEGDAYTMTPQSMRGAGGFGTLGSTPLFVLVHGGSLPAPLRAQEEGWSKAQSRLASLSSVSRTVTARNAGHAIAEDDPALVAKTIGDLKIAIKGGARKL